MARSGHGSGPGRLRLGVVTAATAATLAGLPVSAPASTPANVPVTLRHLLAYQSAWLARNPQNPSQLAVAYREGNQRAVCGLALSHDGGASWHTDNLIGPQGRLPWPKSDEVCYEAQIAWAPDGTLFYAAQATQSFRTPYSRVLLTESRDGGIGWRDPVDVDYHDPGDPAATSGGDWYPRIAAGAGHVYVGWTRYAQRNVTAAQMVAGSADGGLTFTLPVMASPAPPAGSAAVDAFGSALAVGPDGAVYASWTDATQHNAGCTAQVTTTCAQGVPLEVAVSRDGGRSFGTPVTVDGSVNLGCPGRNVSGTGRFTCDALHYDRAPEAFSLAAGPASGAAYLAWWGGDPQQPSRVSFAATRDGGASWSAPTTVGALVGAPSDQQYRPQVAASGARVDLAYYDATPSGVVNVYWTHSTDHGSTFAAPERLTTRPSNLAIGPSGDSGQPGMGEWLGLVSSGTAVDVAWTDTRRGDTDNAEQDIYFATVPLTAAGGGGVWALVAGIGGGVALAAAAAAALLVVARRRRATGAPLALGARTRGR